MTAVIKKAKKSEKRLSFLTIKNPMISVGIIRMGNATHQLAPVSPVNAIIVIAMAAGLNTCLPLIASKYFDAIAIRDMRIAKKNCSKFCAGETIKNKINAVIAKDSMFSGALKILDKILLNM